MSDQLPGDWVTTPEPDDGIWTRCDLFEDCHHKHAANESIYRSTIEELRETIERLELQKDGWKREAERKREYSEHLATLLKKGEKPNE